MELCVIFYFQSVHYIVHVKGIKHPNLFLISNNHWFYHDGLKVGYYNSHYVKGLIFENFPKLDIDLSLENELKPSLLENRVKIDQL